MTTHTTPRRRALLRTTIQLDESLREHRLAAARWAVAQGRTLNVDALTVILAARRHEASIERRPLTRWTSKSLLTFLFDTSVQWCRANGVERPDGCGETLLTYLDFLADHSSLAPGSSSIEQLRRTVSHLCGLTAAGFSSSDDAAYAAIAPIPLRRRA